MQRFHELEGYLGKVPVDITKEWLELKAMKKELFGLFQWTFRQDGDNKP